MTGWISLHRSIEDHWTFKEDRVFSKFEAWVDILLMVNHKDQKVLLGNELIMVKRGQKITSIRKLCDRWSWSNKKVKNFLNVLEGDGMLSVKSDTKKTVLTVANYDVYQNENLKKRHESDTKATPKHHGSNTEASRMHTNNNDNNANNANNDSIMNNNDKKTADIREIIAFYENNGFGITAPPSVVEEIDGWYEEGFEKDAIIHAYRIGVEENKKTDKYIRGIIKNWRQAKTYSVADIDREEQRRKVTSFKNQNKKQLPEESRKQYENLF